jgi:hypothetical protein
MKDKPVHASKVIKAQIIAELSKTVESIEWSNRVGGKVRDPEMLHAIACHKAALRLIDHTPASIFPLGDKMRSHL